MAVPVHVTFGGLTGEFCEHVKSSENGEGQQLESLVHFSCRSGLTL